MALIDQVLQIGRFAVDRLHCEWMSNVVTPRLITRKRTDRHQLNRVDAEITQVIETIDDVSEASGSAVTPAEFPDVKFVDRQFLVLGQGYIVVLPLEIGSGRDVPTFSNDDERTIAVKLVDQARLGVGYVDHFPIEKGR